MTEKKPLRNISKFLIVYCIFLGKSSALPGLTRRLFLRVKLFVNLLNVALVNSWTLSRVLLSVFDSINAYLVEAQCPADRINFSEIIIPVQDEAFGVCPISLILERRTT